MSENNYDASGLTPGYVPAEEDSIILIRFVGNTAQIADFQTKSVDAFQILAMSQFLEMKGKQTIAAIEAEAMQRAAQETREKEIVVASKVPSAEELKKMPPGMRPAGS